MHTVSLHTRVWFASLFAIIGYAVVGHIQTGLETQLGQVSACIDTLGTDAQQPSCNQVG